MTPPNGNSNTGETLIFSCAGAAHCGQVANRTAIELTRAGKGQIFCLAAVSAEIPDKMERTRNAGVRVAIDGCEDHCARKTLERAHLSSDLHVDLSTMGIGKKPTDSGLIVDARKAFNRIAQSLAALSNSRQEGGLS